MIQMVIALNVWTNNWQYTHTMCAVATIRGLHFEVMVLVGTAWCLGASSARRTTTFLIPVSSAMSHPPLWMANVYVKRGSILTGKGSVRIALPLLTDSVSYAHSRIVLCVITKRNALSALTHNGQLRWMGNVNVGLMSFSSMRMATVLYAM